MDFPTEIQQRALGAVVLGYYGANAQKTLAGLMLKQASVKEMLAFIDGVLEDEKLQLG